VSTGQQLPTFRKIILPKSSEPSSPRTDTLERYWTLKMKALRAIEMSATTYRSTRRNISEKLNILSSLVRT
jgi:hypothetical protein